MASNVLGRGDSLRGYHKCAATFATRRKGRDYKVLSHNQTLEYDEHRDCYIHLHHGSPTVKLFREYVQLSTCGWDTTTTWAKMHQMARFCVTGRPSASYVGSKFLQWRDDEDGKARITEFHDDIAVDYEGVPLNPQPVRVKRMRKGATAEFGALRKAVLSRLGLRVAVGEFDTVMVKALDGKQLLRGMQKMVAADIDKWWTTEELAPFFARRPRQSFGRVRYIDRDADEEAVPAIKRLESNLNAARTAWVAEQYDLYETKELEQ